MKPRSAPRAPRYRRTHKNGAWEPRRGMSWARTFLVGALVTVTGCVSSFEFAVDAQHPSRPEATGGSDLKAPSPFEIQPPKVGESNASQEHQQMHGGKR